MSRKLCSKCLQLKNISAFHRRNARKIGVQPACAECRNAHRRRRRRLRREGATGDLFAPAAGNPKTSPGFYTRGDKTEAAPAGNPDRKLQARCRSRVYRAVVAGRLVRPGKCSLCGRTAAEAGQLYAHHEDYGKPLDVKFLCASCHGIVHSHLRRCTRTGVANPLGGRAETVLPVAV